MIRQFYIQKA